MYVIPTLLITASFFLFDAEGSGICDDKNHEVLPLLGGHDRYILCLFRRELIVICPPGTIFDLNVKDCVPENPIPPWLEVCKEGVLGNQPLPGSCVYYVFCFLGFGDLRQCPSGQIFIDNKCVKGNQSSCTPEFL